MPIVIPEGYGQAVIRIPGPSSASADASCIIGFHVEAGVNVGPSPITNTIGSAKRIFSATNAFLAPRLCIGWSFSQVTAVANWADVLYQGSWIGSTLNGAVANGHPPSSSVLVRKVTTLGGKHHRGRMYIPGVLADSQVDGAGVIASADVTIFQNAINDWVNAMMAPPTDTETQISLWLLHNQKVGGPIAPSPTAIVAHQVQPTIATQRRRLR